MEIATPHVGSTIEGLKTELERCLRLLASRFPDSEFREHLPGITIKDGFAPLPEELVREEESHTIVLYSRGDLNRPVEQVLTILLHKAVHAANAFRWRRDCSSNSYHNSEFRTLAEQVGFHVAHSEKRYGWAQTTPDDRLFGIFHDLAVREDLLAPFQPDDFMRRYIRYTWNCGFTKMPTRSELMELQAFSSCQRDRRYRRDELTRAATVNRTWQNDESVPMVRLSGKWLRNVGFQENTRFKVEVGYGQLKIESRDL